MGVSPAVVRFARELDGGAGKRLGEMAKVWSLGLRVAAAVVSVF
jgi:hypothetical protein